LPVEQLAQRAGIARTTLIRLEHGDGGAAISTLAKTLFALGLEQDLLLIAKDDLMGYRMQDAGLLVKKRYMVGGAQKVAILYLERIFSIAVGINWS
jgi:hypothetical protein